MSLLKPLNQPLRDWRGQRVWIVGASTGIGAALARQLADQGALVALSARSRERLTAAAAGCGEGAVIEPMDVTRAEDYARVRERLVTRWGSIDLVVLNAGTYGAERAWELSDAGIRATLETNLIGVMNGVGSVTPMFCERGAGAIAIVGSAAGYGGLPRSAVYGPSKAALINFAESLYLDLKPRGISVFLISPGFVATPLTARNNFRMPALISVEEAAGAIMAGLARGSFEIHFPKRFTCVLRALRWLPRRAYFALVRRLTGAR